MGRGGLIPDGSLLLLDELGRDRLALVQLDRTRLLAGGAAAGTDPALKLIAFRRYGRQRHQAADLKSSAADRTAVDPAC